MKLNSRESRKRKCWAPISSLVSNPVPPTLSLTSVWQAPPSLGTHLRTPVSHPVLGCLLSSVFYPAVAVDQHIYLPPYSKLKFSDSEWYQCVGLVPGSEWAGAKSWRGLQLTEAQASGVSLPVGGRKGAAFVQFSLPRNYSARHKESPQ